MKRVEQPKHQQYHDWQPLDKLFVQCRLCGEVARAAFPCVLTVCSGSKK